VTDPKQHTANNTYKLSDIATIEQIMLREIKASDLVVSNRLSLPINLRNLADKDFTSLIFQPPPSSLNLTPTNSESNKNSYLNKQYFDFGDDSDIFERLQQDSTYSWTDKFLEHQLRVVRIKDISSYMSRYVQIQIEKNLPEMLKQSPENGIKDCPIAVLQLEDQAKAVCERDWHISLNHPESPSGNDYLILQDVQNDIFGWHDNALKLLSTTPINLNELDNHLGGGKQIFDRLPQMWPYRATEGCPNYPDVFYKLVALRTAFNAPDPLIAFDSREDLESILEDWAGEKKFWLENSRPSLFEFVFVARLLRALPDRRAFFNKIVIEKHEAEARADEKKAVMGILCHDIKNLLTDAVVDPMLLMKREGAGDRAMIEQVLRGARRLGRIVNAVNKSQGGKKEDFWADLQNPNKEAEPVKTIVETSLRAAFTNMLDGTYFKKYYSIHFPTTDLFYEAKDKFIHLPSGNIEQLLAFGREYLIDCIEWNCAEDILSKKVGAINDSDLKLTILFQELFLNAVKNTTLTTKNRRFLSVLIEHAVHGIRIKITNSYNPDNPADDTHIGNTIIDSFLEQFGALDVCTKQEDGIFMKQFILCGEQEVV